VTEVPGDDSCVARPRSEAASELVERRRTKPIDELTNVSDHRLYLLGGRDEQFVGAWEIRAGEVTDGLECERQPGQRRSEAVVEVAPDSSALLFAKLDDTLSRQLQFLGESVVLSLAGEGWPQVVGTTPLSHPRC
jgi:hypothetical protein